MNRKAALQPGKTYWARANGYLHCLCYDSVTGEGRVVNTKTGYACTIKDAELHPDGHLSWGYASQGGFDERAHLRAKIAELESLHDNIEDALLGCQSVSDELKADIRAVLTKLHNARWSATWELAAAGKEGSRQDAEAQGN